jgi:hypothetical protein
MERMSNAGLVPLFAGVLILLVAATSLFAQTANTGAIAGTVSDSTGAIIPGVTVTATRTGTGAQRTMITVEDGTYRFTLLDPGEYSVKFTLPGFQTKEAAGVTVTVTETSVLNQKLEVGQQSQDVVVEANIELIQTATASLGTTVAGSQVTSLPLTSRNYTNLLALSPGVQAAVTNASTLGKGGLDFSVNGAQTYSNNIQIDGANIASLNGNNSNQDQFNSYGNTPVPNPDVIQEFKIQTSGFDAGYGRGSGANVNVVTKSGTNDWHGSAFEFLRNTALNANDFFLNRANRPKGILNQNQFGGTFGGPIKKDKLFFFVGYQGTTQKNGLAAQGNTAINLPPIPGGPRENTDVFRRALGASLCPQNHPGDLRYNTLRGGVQVSCDGSTINDTAIKLLQAKLPDGTYMLPGSGINDFQATNISIPARYTENQVQANVDYVISNKHTLSVRAFNSYAPATLPFSVGGIGSATTAPGFVSKVLYHTTTGLTKFTSILTPAIVNEARLSWHRDISNFPGNNSGMSDYQFGIQALSPEQDRMRPGFLTTMTITGTYGFGAGGAFHYAFSNSQAIQMADQISWTTGRHTIRFGGEFERIRWWRDYPGIGSGTIVIPTFADFLIGRAGCTPGDAACAATNPTLTDGRPNNGTQFSNMGSATATTSSVGPGGNAHNYRDYNANAFINDDVKLTKRLTVNLGVRYEYLAITHDVLGNYTDLWPSEILKVPIPGPTEAQGTLAGWVVPSNYKGPWYDGLTRASNKSSVESGPGKLDFAPRIGFAWQPVQEGKLVIRGGYGFFYDRIPGVDMITGVNNGPPLAPSNYFSGVGGYFSRLDHPFRDQTSGIYPYRWVNLTTSATSAIGQRFFTSNPRTPLAQNYTLNLQYNFMPSWVLEVGYVGTHTIHGERAYNSNSALVASKARPVWGLTTNNTANAAVRVPYLGFGGFTYACTCFSTKYNSMQVTLRKQFSHGFTATAGYTWNKIMDLALEPSYTGEINGYYGPTGRPQSMKINYSWNIPSNVQGPLGKLINGWNVTGVTTMQSGTFIDITDGRGGTIYNLTSARAIITPGATYAELVTKGDVRNRLGGSGPGFFNLASLIPMTCNATTNPAPCYKDPDGIITNGTGQGNLGRGVAFGPGQFNFDGSLTKSIHVGGVNEAGALLFRAEFFNAFNHAQFGNPVTNFSASNFGQITSTTVNPRVIQLVLKYSF